MTAHTPDYEAGYRQGQSDALDGLLTAKQVAAELDITTTRLRALAHNRHVGYRIGTDRFYRRADVDALRVRNPGRPKV